MVFVCLSNTVSPFPIMFSVCYRGYLRICGVRQDFEAPRYVTEHVSECRPRDTLAEWKHMHQRVAGLEFAFSTRPIDVSVISYTAVFCQSISFLPQHTISDTSIILELEFVPGCEQKHQ